MDREWRERIRQARDRAARERVAREARAERWRTCRTCGALWVDWTLGCATCADRHYALARRRGGHPDPAWYERQRVAHQVEVTRGSLILRRHTNEQGRRTA